MIYSFSTEVSRGVSLLPGFIDWRCALPVYQEYMQGDHIQWADLPFIGERDLKQIGRFRPNNTLIVIGFSYYLSRPIASGNIIIDRSRSMRQGMSNIVFQAVASGFIVTRLGTQSHVRFGSVDNIRIANVERHTVNGLLGIYPNSIVFKWGSSQ